MSRINLGRVLIGGLLAGVIINLSEFLLNGVVLAEDMNAAMAVGSSRVDLQACKLEYSIVSPK